MPSDPKIELFVLQSGRAILSEELSEKMYKIKYYHPERPDENGESFEKR